jgi:hypothetical protein
VKRTPTRGVKECLKPDAYKQSEAQKADDVPLVLWVSDLILASELKPIGVGAAKASLNRAFSSSD